MLDQLESLLLDERCTEELVGEVRLIAEEAASNIVRYAFDSGEERRIEVTLSCNQTEVKLELRDDGRPFNPLEAPPPDLDRPMEQRPDGGLGVFLMKSLADEASYAREGNTNVLVLTKRL